MLFTVLGVIALFLRERDTNNTEEEVQNDVPPVRNSDGKRCPFDVTQVLYFLTWSLCRALRLILPYWEKTLQNTVNMVNWF